MLKSVLKKVGTGLAIGGAYVYGLKKVEGHHANHLQMLARSKEGEIGVYTFPISPYSAKVTSYLDYHGIPYKNVSVNYMTKEEIYFSPEYKKLPIAVVKEKVVPDSTDIIKELSKYSSYDEKVMKIVDDEVVPAVMASTFSSFDTASKAFEGKSRFESMVLPLACPLMTSMAKKSLGDAYNEENLVPSLRKAFAAIGNNRSAYPAELALFGVLRNVHNLTSVQDALAACDKVAWYETIAAKCEQNSKQVQA